MTRTQAIEDARLLLPFLTEWLAWAEADAPRHPAFDAGYGLCSNADYWDTEAFDPEKEEYCAYPTTKALRRALSLFNDPAYPFNTAEGYYRASDKLAHHTNAKRLNWVRRKIARLTAVLAALDDPNTST